MSLRDETSTTGRHLPALDGLRGLAVLMVLGFHMMWASQYSGRNPVIWLAAAMRSVGWAGVDLFFVLSGFLITGILYDTSGARHYFRNFYARRALRILPLYYLVLVGSVLLGLAAGGHFGAVGFAESAAFVRNIPVPRPKSLPALSGVGWVQLDHLWSMAVEEQFYLLWPLVVFALRTRRRIALAALAGVVGSLAVRLWLFHDPVLARYQFLMSSWTPARLDELCAGALLAMLVRSSWEQRVLRLSPWVLAAGAITFAVWSDHFATFSPLTDRWGEVWVYSILAVTFTALLAVSLRGGWVTRVLSGRSMRFFGRYSYGMYLFHYTISEGMTRLRPTVSAWTHSRLLGVVLPALSGFALTVGAAMWSFRFFEEPFLRLKTRFADTTPTAKLEDYVAEATAS